MSLQEHILALRRAMEEAGVRFKGDIEADGEIHRVHIDGHRKGSRNGWYLLHLDGKPAGSFGDYKAGLKVKLSAQGVKPLDREERRALREKIKADRERREAEEGKRQAIAAERANRIWVEASPSNELHPYLKRKDVPSFGLRVATWQKDIVNKETGEVEREIRVPNALLVPIRDRAKRIVSLQAIFPDNRNALHRDTDFLPDGEKKGCYFVIGTPTEIEGRLTIFFVEGYSTGASVHLATGGVVIVCFDAGNLEPVVATFRENFTDARLVICADNDRWTGPPKHAIDNPGVTYARRAARTVDAIVAVPDFKDLDSEPTDFNDLHTAEGLGVVKRRILAAINSPAAPPAPVEAPAPMAAPAEPAPAAPAPAAPAPAAASASVPPPADDDDLYASIDPRGSFAILGYNKDAFFFYQHEKKQIAEYRARDLQSEGVLMALAPLQWWQMNFPGEKGMDKRAATNWLIRLSYRRGIFSPKVIRGRGAWDDEGRLVFHFGHMLTVDGVVTDVTKIAKTQFVYELKYAMPMPAAERLSDEEGRKLLALAESMRWKRPASAPLLAGWCALAPLCGALSWRPHIWLTGEAGCGKSTILNQYVYPLMNEICVFAQGGSSEPGMRQELKKDALPLLFDEAEQNNERERNRMEGVLAMVRQASTESRARTLKGTTSGEALDFHIRSMFVLSSIQVGIRQQADRERFAKLELKKKGGEGSEEHWKRLKDALYKLTNDKVTPARLLRRSLDLLPITRQNIDVFVGVAAKRFGNQRDGDQYGTLLAGAWSLKSSKIVTYPEAEAWIDSLQWDEHLEESETVESTRVLQALVSAKLRLKGGIEVSVSEVVHAAAGLRINGVNLPPDDANAVLRRHGMRVKIDDEKQPMAGKLLLANDSHEIPRLLERTPYAADWRGHLLRIEGIAQRHAYDSGKPRNERFSGPPERCISVALSAILEEDAPKWVPPKNDERWEPVVEPEPPPHDVDPQDPGPPI